jgi:hypothetical protein
MDDGSRLRCCGRDLELIRTRNVERTVLRTYRCEVCGAGHLFMVNEWSKLDVKRQSQTI